MDPQNVNVSSTMIIGAIFSIVAFILVTLMGIIGWSLKNAFDDYKKDREEVRHTLVSDRVEMKAALAADKSSFEGKVEKLAMAFAGELKVIGVEFMNQVKEVKTELAGLSKSMSELARIVISTKEEVTMRYEQMEKRQDLMHQRVEGISARTHDLGNEIQKSIFGVAANTKRLDIIEHAILGRAATAVVLAKKNPMEDPSYVHPGEDTPRKRKT